MSYFSKLQRANTCCVLVKQLKITIGRVCLEGSSPFQLPGNQKSVKQGNRYKKISQEIIFIAIKIKKRTTNPLGFVKAFIVGPLRLFEFGLATLQLTRT
jgi:hypothetical protein